MKPSKFNFSGAQFLGATVVGDKTVQYVNKADACGQQIVADGELSSKLAQLLTQLRAVAADSPQLDAPAKQEVSKAVITVADELARPTERRDVTLLGRAWERIVTISRDLGPVLEVARTIAPLAGLPLP